MWTRNSSRNIPRAETIGGGIDGPSGQIVVMFGGHFDGHCTPGLMLSHTSISTSRSARRPSPDSMRCMILSSHDEPSRHGVHWPHDSREKKRTRRHDARTMHVFVSMAMIEPEPIIEPPSPLTLVSSSGMSRRSGPNQNDDAPPGMKALSSAPLRMPAPKRGS